MIINAPLKYHFIIKYKIKLVQSYEHKLIEFIKQQKWQEANKIFVCLSLAQKQLNELVDQVDHE